MTPTTSSSSRLELVSRAALSRRGFVSGSLSFAALVALAACGNSDEEVLTQVTTGAGADTTTAGTTAAPTDAAETTAAAADTTVAAAETTAAAAETTAAAAGVALPAGAKLVVNFSYVSTESGGRVHNPYIAVWIENADGELVQTIALWMKAGKTKYLNSLERWYTVESARLSEGGEDVVDEISSATRVAGAYSLEWDGTTIDGGAAVQGDYYVCIEAAREHGPYELIRDVITLGATATSVTFADNGELAAASAQYVV